MFHTFIGAKDSMIKEFPFMADQDSIIQEEEKALRNMFAFYHKQRHPISTAWDLTPEFKPRDHTFRYNSYHACPAVKPAGIHDLMFPILAFVLGLFTLGLFFSGIHDGVLFWLGIFFPVCTIAALLKK